MIESTFSTCVSYLTGGGRKMKKIYVYTDGSRKRVVAQKKKQSEAQAIGSTTKVAKIANADELHMYL